MTYTNKDQNKAWHRANKTRKTLEKALAEGAPAKRVAELSTRLDVQRKQFQVIRDSRRLI